jgi:uncharacterized protein
MISARILLGTALLILAVAGLARAADVPYLTGRVVDNAELLAADAQDRIGSLLKEHEARTGNQVAVLTVSALEGDSIEEFSLKVFNTWKLGQKSKDNGVLLVVVPRERKMRIEVGYGLEGTLTDVAASRIIRNVMAPSFKAGDFNAGVEKGVTAIIAQLEGREAPAAAEGPPGHQASTDSGLSAFPEPDLPLTERILFGAFIFGIIGLFTVLGVLTPGMGWFLYFFLIPFWAMFPIIVVGTGGALKLLVTYLVAFPVAKILVARRPWYKNAQRDLKTKGKAHIGGFALGGGSGSSGSSGSSWSSSSSSSSGSYSGGGGSSGGGGASGSW